jgi:ubiquitin-like modifier-activating enzyme ATG7
LLAYLRALYPTTTSTLRILCWRDSEALLGHEKSWKSRFGTIYIDATSTPAAAGAVATRPSAVGWEKNVQGKLGARMADLAPMMDPSRYVLSLLSLVIQNYLGLSLSLDHVWF